MAILKQCNGNAEGNGQTEGQDEKLENGQTEKQDKKKTIPRSLRYASQA